MTARPRKVDTIVLGRGLAAATLAWALAQAGRRVALLVEEPGWAADLHPAWVAAHPTGEQATLAARGAAMLQAWQAQGLPGITEQPIAGGESLWLLDYDRLLPALGEQLGAGEGCWCAVGTRVRGISVIENAILGAIAEDARYDARQLVNAAEDERHSAFARMMRHPRTLDLQPSAPVLPTPLPRLEQPTLALLTAPRPHDRGAPVAEETPVRGAWRLAGVAGWPLLALGLAADLADRLPPPTPKPGA